MSLFPQVIVLLVAFLVSHSGIYFYFIQLMTKLRTSRGLKNDGFCKTMLLMSTSDKRLHFPCFDCSSTITFDEML